MSSLIFNFNQSVIVYQIKKSMLRLQLERTTKNNFLHRLCLRLIGIDTKSHLYNCPYFGKESIETVQQLTLTPTLCTITDGVIYCKKSTRKAKCQLPSWLVALPGLA